MNAQDIIKRKRRELGMKQPAFANLVGVNQSTVSRWEKGIAKPSKPTLSYIEMLSADRADT